MTYALETKKRKFERILESLTDNGNNARNNNASTTTTTALAKSLASNATGGGVATSTSTSISPSVSATSLLTAARDAAAASKRRRVTPTSAGGSRVTSLTTPTTTTSLTGHYLPSSRPAFLERLETFRQVTRWHVPSTEKGVNAAKWAGRGWVCVMGETDTVGCGSCEGRVRVDISGGEEGDTAGERGDDNENGDEVDDGGGAEDEFAMAGEVHAGLVKRYEEMIITAHTESCPWRKRGCDASIHRIEGLLNTMGAMEKLQARYHSIVPKVQDLPAVAALPNDNDTVEEELEKVRFVDEKDQPPVLNALRLAACGWQTKDEEVIECRHCFRSLGLWLYRGNDPTMEKLDPVESHLEYCPWRSPESQDTELSLSSADGVQRKVKLAGWQLVLQAVAKDNAKKRPAPGMRSSVALASSGTPTADQKRPMTSESSMTPEQREKRRNDLMRRIKDLKKPFNFKNLVRRKEKETSKA